MPRVLLRRAKSYSLGARKMAITKLILHHEDRYCDDLLSPPGPDTFSFPGQLIYFCGLSCADCRTRNILDFHNPLHDVLHDGEVL